VKNPLHAVALKLGIAAALKAVDACRPGTGKLQPCGSVRRADLLRQLEVMDAQIAQLDQAVRKEAKRVRQRCG